MSDSDRSAKSEGRVITDIAYCGIAIPCYVLVPFVYVCVLLTKHLSNTVRYMPEQGNREGMYQVL